MLALPLTVSAQNEKGLRLPRIRKGEVLYQKYLDYEATQHTGTFRIESRVYDSF